MKISCIIFFAFLLNVSNVCAQYAAQKDASYIATLKAVLDYKMNDEENIRELEDLRENEQFNQKLSLANRIVGKTLAEDIIVKGNNNKFGKFLS